jgi:hypothetical protein
MSLPWLDGGATLVSDSVKVNPEGKSHKSCKIVELKQVSAY